MFTEKIVQVLETSAFEMLLSEDPLTSLGLGIVELLEGLENVDEICLKILSCYKMATAPAGMGMLCKCSIRFMIWPVGKVLHNRTGTYMHRSK